MRNTLRSTSRHLQLYCSLFWVLAGCSGLGGPTLPSTTTAFHPPQVYAKWWDMVLACANIQKPFPQSGWYYVPAVSAFRVGSLEVAGLWISSGPRIVLAERARLDGQTARHEMLHAVLADGGHPREYFADRCSGVVSCRGQCDKDAGELDENAYGPPTRVPVASLLLEAVVNPHSPTLGRDSLFTVTMRMTNPFPYPILLETSSHFNARPSAALEYIGPAEKPSRTYSGLFRPIATLRLFRAHEVKYQVFDLGISTDSATLRRGMQGAFATLTVSTYEFRVGLDQHWSPLVSATITQ